MAVLSGIRGTVFLESAEVVPVTQWELAIVAKPLPYVANDTDGWTKRAEGAKDSRGFLRVAVTDSGRCPVELGQPMVLELHVDDSGENYYRLEAFVEQVGVAAEIDKGELVNFAIAFRGNGPVTPFGVLKTEEV